MRRPENSTPRFTILIILELKISLYPPSEEPFYTWHCFYIFKARPFSSGRTFLQQHPLGEPAETHRRHSHTPDTHRPHTDTHRRSRRSPLSSREQLNQRTLWESSRAGRVHASPLLSLSLSLSLSLYTLRLAHILLLYSLRRVENV